ncbi:outer membrane protein/peptidoglycan-associated (lipo)protein [Bernardetia litoralis DSM 6794]|uniref:Outer membrane protein/peptidoglycan-associated (Lipo)protein n=1 Tax=Bernardetia litoralis (strain ATCC 23117 / DSM 6794 / NBRC 15988 / NCIMB 1366 / Fx l1 / Sio-4) TaxID=880071 RepID=I4ANZ8_BERLS|nr:OmpA family protein [Bernardetia litoralis]AFM05683.1 outer membrane protein/peptidoglycan-associated (lipo)protein [Bernardetia litoralis DSM 6794]
MNLKKQSQKGNSIKLFLALGFLFAFFTGCSSVYQKAESEFDRAAYNKAITLYQSYLAKNPAKAAEVNYKIAEAYRRSNRLPMALPYYIKTTEAGTDKLTTGDRDTLRYYTAEALKVNQKYDEAKAQFEDYAKLGINQKLKTLAQSEIENLSTINQIAEANEYVTVVPCDGMNTESSDFAPTKWMNKLVFSSDRRKEATYEGTGQGFYDLYSFETENDISDTTNACIGTVRLWGGEIFNQKGTHDASATFSPDGNNVVFARSGNGDKKGESDKEVSLYTSSLNNGIWSEAKPLSYVNSTYWDGTPHISKDGKTLYFSSNRASSKGGLDIYKASFNERDKTWANVERLGDDINTEGNEMFPYIDEKGRFFFASDGQGGLGGLDIFVQEEMKNPNDTSIIKKIRNVGAPINSAGDDFGLTFTEKDDKGGYFTSKRENPVAKLDSTKIIETNDDIYRFHLDSLDIREVRYVLRGTVEGIDKVENTRDFLSGVELDLNLGNNNVVKVSTDDKGKFLFDTSLVIGKVYDIDVNAAGYLPKNDNAFSMVGRGLDKSKLTQMYTLVYFDTAFVLTKDFFVTGGGEGKDMLPPEIEILYDLNKATLTSDATEKLDNFVVFLKEYLAMYPDAKLIMGSHTDSRGSNGYNQRLSQRRANSAVNYIIAKGVAKDRIKAVGYGENRLKVKNAKTEEEHQLNRRTTVEVAK